jgi:hypothetical protein
MQASLSRHVLLSLVKVETGKGPTDQPASGQTMLPANLAQSLGPASAA